MNAVVETTGTAVAEISEKEQAASNAIATQIADLSRDLIPIEIARDAFKYNSFGQQAVVQVEKAVLDTPEKFGLAGDLMKAISSNLKAGEEARKSRTDLLRSRIDYITKLFTPGLTKLEDAKKALQKKLNVYAEQLEKQQREEAAKKQKAAEEQALALAQTQMDMGDAKGASEVLDSASKAIDKIGEGAKATGRGVYGSTSHGVKRWVGSVENPAHFLTALIALDPEKILDYVEFKPIALNALAKRMGEAKDKKEIAGFKFEQVRNQNVR